MTPVVLNKRRDKIPADAVLVDRTTKWGNIFKIGHPHPRTGKPMTRKDAIAEYADRLDAIIHHGLLDLDELQGKDLVCWCAPLPCHADILLEMANK